jgi:carboxymethylenebutenolidase
LEITMSGNSDRDPEGSETKSPQTTRREFVAASAAIGLAATAGVSVAADASVIERDVEIPTADGKCDAALFCPASGTHPGVLIWTDIFGLRPAFRGMGRRLAARGYTVLVPNPFYRTGRAPLVANASTFDFANPTDRAKLEVWTKPLKQSGPIERDAEAYAAFLDAQPQVDRARKLGTQGYCWGGPPRRLCGDPARLVRSGYAAARWQADLLQAGGRTCLEPSAGALSFRTGVSPSSKVAVVAPGC